MSLALTLALYAAAISFVGGVAWRVWVWAATPEPFHIPTTTAQQRALTGIKASRVESPSTWLGVIGRMCLEGFLFRSLFRNTAFGKTSAGRRNSEFRNQNAEAGSRKPEAGQDAFPGFVFLERKALWLGAMAFHWSLLVIVVRHLRLFIDPIPRFVAGMAAFDGFFDVGLPTWYATDVIIVFALGFLLFRRLRDPLLRYLTLPADYLALAALMAVAGTGIALRYWARVDLVALRGYTLGLAALAPVPVPGPGFWLAAHLLSVSFLLAILPFTKMIHAAGVWLSPTRNQANDSRRRRHVNPWNAPVPVHGYDAWQDEFRDKLRIAALPIDEVRLEGPRPE
jgi:nitrate reductase gamma subunit